MAESMNWHLCRFSNAIKKNFKIPSPRFEFKSFKAEILKIIQDQNIDILIPTCEEVFYLSQFKSDIEVLCTAFLLDEDQLMDLHNKNTFIMRAQKIGLRVPKTLLVYSLKDLRDNREKGKKYIFKPSFSRFGTQIQVLPADFDETKVTDFSLDNPLLMQEFIGGEEYCAFTILREGQLKAFSVYKKSYTAGNGACIYFSAEKNQEIKKWIERFLESSQYTGQVSFDFKIDDGLVYPLECNPRTTSGIHLFKDSKSIVDSFFDGEYVDAANDRKEAMIALAMVIFELPRMKNLKVHW